jgi:hypothetical protein
MDKFLNVILMLLSLGLGIWVSYQRRTAPAKAERAFGELRIDNPDPRLCLRGATAKVIYDNVDFGGQLKFEAYQQAKSCIKPEHSWQEAVVRYLSSKQHLRSLKDVQRICRRLDPVPGKVAVARDHR